MIIDISEIYAMDILVGDILYSIPNDLFYKITRVVKEDWIILYTDTDTGEFSWGLNKTERLNKYEFRLYRKRMLPYEQQ